VDTQQKGTPAVTSVGARFRIISYPQHLLNLARKLIDDGEFNVSVVILHMACEIAVEKAIYDWCTKQGKPIPQNLDGYNGYSLAKDKNRKAYTLLTGDQIQQKPFWQKYKESTDRRNKIIHSDYRSDSSIERVKVEESFSAASDFVAHIEK
jgi:hypothetical protein